MTKTPCDLKFTSWDSPKSRNQNELWTALEKEKGIWAFAGPFWVERLRSFPWPSCELAKSSKKKVMQLRNHKARVKGKHTRYFRCWGLVDLLCRFYKEKLRAKKETYYNLGKSSSHNGPATNYGRWQSWESPPKLSYTLSHFALNKPTSSKKGKHCYSHVLDDESKLTGHVATLWRTWEQNSGPCAMHMWF